MLTLNVGSLKSQVNNERLQIRPEPSVIMCTPVCDCGWVKTHQLVAPLQKNYEV